MTHRFIYNHLGLSEEEINQVLNELGFRSMDELIDKTIPPSIRLEEDPDLPEGMSEYDYIKHIREIAGRNQLFKSFIGLGYYPTITPGVIQRNILENPGWYTAYTPYQAEISQGRLEALLNFQTMVSDLTGLPIANASLLDEATAAAEAMLMFYNARSREQVKAGFNRFLVSENLFPQTIDVLKTRSKPYGIELMIVPDDQLQPAEGVFGMIVQYPDEKGEIKNWSQLVKKAHEHGIKVAAACDIMSLVMLEAPGNWGADAALGSTQRFGIPMGFGGPHAAYLATTEEFKRHIPGRIIGISRDKAGKPALRMALQTREQHIKRERATSNICTAQALLAIMAGFYAVYHGPEGLRAIAHRIHRMACLFAGEVTKYGYKVINNNYFDTVTVDVPEEIDIQKIRTFARNNQVNLRYFGQRFISVAMNETTTIDDVILLLNIFCVGASKKFVAPDLEGESCMSIPVELMRKDQYLTHPVFNSYHSETALMRYMKILENRDLALNRTMIPLGSCTMKLNAASEMIPLSWPEFSTIHPFVPEYQAKGYLDMIREMEEMFCSITGFKAISFMPNSGASGEYTGLLVIRAWHESRGESQRNICLIPASAHGTNPASATMAGMQVVVVKCDDKGNIDVEDLKQKAEKYSDTLAALMVTYPSTHGVFEEAILEIVDIVHKSGGQVYMDGANMNAQTGLTSPARIGADVCHLNLHKTFAIPHGGGGPGVGPIGVAEHLVPFLPGHPFIENKGDKAITAVAAAPYGSPLILPISYGYLKMLGKTGLRKSTEVAILNANYLKHKLQNDYKILYTGKNGMVAHEMIIDCNPFSKTAGITVIDIAKRLIDFGIHAPTVAFPVHGTLMVEPTESEPLSELNRFVDAMLKIRQEIRDIEEGKIAVEDSPLRQAPHTAEELIAGDWDRPYSRIAAAYPEGEINPDKYWPPVQRIDDAWGDRNLVCTCQPIEAYQ
ncbi:MAG: aminomethyl-transferring glycine dehydrogenase [Bacteroidales bacterium]